MRISKSLRDDFLTYAVGYVLAVLLTVIAFAFCYFHWLTTTTTFGLILFLAFIQIIVHLRCFLHISLSRSARADLQLILFSAVIIMTMVGGTLIVLFNLKTRMM